MPSTGLRMKYTVIITRTSYSSTGVEVEADSEEQAREIAMDEAGDHSYSEHSADYEIDSIISNALNWNEDGKRTNGTSDVPREERAVITREGGSGG